MLIIWFWLAKKTWIKYTADRWLMKLRQKVQKHNNSPHCMTTFTPRSKVEFSEWQFPMYPSIVGIIYIISKSVQGVIQMRINSRYHKIVLQSTWMTKLPIW
jgi:hypothetical protein